ncbi:MAG: succinate dehydrogenase, hydrophobic membrane anchor protein [Rhodospirillales bacterium]|nr:succinate dehydrogenase, hydrophobic membrane anchor protein [Rhodospirillales bacterium]
MSETAKSSVQRGAHDPARVHVMRTQLGRARGLGAAHGGTHHWWVQRLTAIALVPLSLWFIYAVLHLAGAPRAYVAHWAGHPVNAALLAALVVATFHHAQLGLQVVVDDYVHTEATRMAVLLLIKGLAALLALISLVAVLKLAFTG